MELTRNVKIGAALLVAAIVATVAVVVGGDSRDPRGLFAERADDVCAEFATELRGIASPMRGEDPAGWAATVAESYSEFANQLEAVDADGPATSISETLVAATRRVSGEAGRLSELKDAAWGPADEYDTELNERIATLNAEFGSLAEWGSVVCSQPMRPGQAPPQGPSPAEQWMSAVEAACAKTTDALAELDAVAGRGEVDVDGYAERLAVRLTELDEALEAAGTPPDDFADVADDVRAEITAAAAAAAAGDLGEVREASDRWSDVASAGDLGACAVGVASAAANPSGLVEVPTFGPAPEGVGIDAERVTDADAAAAYLAGIAVAGSGIDADRAFSVAEVIAAAGVPVAAGTTADAGTVAVSEARTANGGEASEENPWVVTFIASDGTRCAGRHLSGFPRLTTWTGTDGTCDAAAGPQPNA